jgi:hypothetical protein
MASSSEIQRTIDSAVSSRETWNAELLSLNKQLVNAKGTTKTRLKRAIKNAEDQVKDLDRSILKLNNDLKRVANTEMKQADNIELAKQGITPGKDIVNSIIGGAKDITGMLVNQSSGSLPITDKPTQKSADAPNGANVTFEGDAKKKLYLIIGGAILLLILLMKKK